MSSFIEQFNLITEDKYKYLRVLDTEFNQTENILSITFSIPYGYLNQKFTDEDKKIIAEKIKELVPKAVETIKIYYNSIQISEDVVLRYVVKYIKEHYLSILADLYKQKDIEITISNEDVYIVIPVDESLESYCSQNIKLELENYLNSLYFALNHVTFRKTKIEKVKDTLSLNNEIYVDTYVVDLKNKIRIILGKGISSTPFYISKYKKEVDFATIAGRVTRCEEKTSKTGKNFYILNIEDPSKATMNCLYFPRSEKRKVFDKVNIGDELLLRGEIKINTTYNSASLFIKDAMLVEIDWKGVEDRIRFVELQRIKQKVPKPIKYEDKDKKQEYSLFVEQDYICSLLRNRSFVVFDTETTGLDRDKDRVIEIGAIKIENGEITEVFETLIDPKIPIPQEASNINHITDEMVTSSPYFEDAIVEFLDFTRNCSIVGQNVGFDIAFIKRQANEAGYKFNPEKVYDTLDFARKLSPGERTYRLSSLCKRYGVSLENAHRACDDALATAKLFIKMANLLKLED